MMYLYWYLGIGALLAMFVHVHRLVTQKEEERLAWTALVLFALIWPLGLPLFIGELRSKELAPRMRCRDDFAFEIEPGELGRRVTIEEVEQCEMVGDPLGGAPRLPFGHLNHVWEQFKAVIEPGMELYTFSASYPGWGGISMCTKSGYVIVIDGAPGRYHLTEIISRPTSEDVPATSDEVARFLQPGAD
ncbi:hypothetical protein [Pseudoduganella sp.]|uniref:hypothetical protein n=1 Tax=Pseudoduganella sp. TaxID=1880898 RepID=UPI0035B23D93